MEGLSPETRKILLSISEDEWRGYYRELVLYSHARCRRWFWRTGGSGNLPSGYSPDAIAREAITRLYDGSRRWNHEQYPDRNPVPFLKSVIDSIIWALLSGAENKRKTTVKQEHSTDGHDQTQDFEDAEEGTGLSPSSALAPDTRIYLEDVERRIRTAIADRLDLVEFFEHLLEGLKPGEIAARMNTDVKRIYAMRKTFDRRTANIQRELFGLVEQADKLKEGR
jgi:DNA-directed RNA polymerase specialized sigma24 family protein